jgi:CheY-like chemotaxis protein
MDTIVLERTKNLGKDLSLLLLTFGMKGIPVCTREEALEALHTYSTIRFCIVDIDNESTGGLQFIKEIRQDTTYAGLKIIVHTIQKIQQIQSTMMQLGVVGSLLKPFEQGKTSYQLKRILPKIFFPGTEKRHHIRIRTDPDDLIRVHFKIKNYPHLVYGKILDMSIAGMAVELLKSPPRAFLAERTSVPHLSFSLDYKPVNTSGIIKVVRGKILVIHFYRLGTGEKNIISRYIFRRISA